MAKFKIVFFILFIFSHSSYAITSHYFEQKNVPLTVDFGFRYLRPVFNPISNVVIRNQAISNETGPVYGNVDQSYPDTFAQTLRADILLSEANKTVLSLQTFLPLNSLAQMDSGNIYLPEYVLYRTENQRPRVSAMAEMNLSDQWRMGLGVDLGFGVTSEATIYLQSGAGLYSNQRISASVKPRIIPMAVVEFESYRLLIKGENKVDFSLSTNAGTAILPPLTAGFDFNYKTSSVMFFDPWTLDLSRSFSLENLGLETWNINLGLAYQLWSRYEARAAVIQNITNTFSNGLTPAFEAKNIFVPRIAFEKQFTNQRWELGYQYKDSIFKSTPTLNGNYLDPPRHDFTLGSIFVLNSGWEFGVTAQVSRLAEQNVVKQNSGEIGASKLGTGYQASGWLLGGSVNLTVPFETKKI